MLLYRAHALADNINHMVIGQQVRGWSGAKQQGLDNRTLQTLRSIIRGGVTLVRLPSDPTKIFWESEYDARARLLRHVAATIPNAVILMSDVDEIPDPARMPILKIQDECRRLRLKHTYYSPRCFFGPWGRGGTLVHTGSRTFKSWMTRRRSARALNEIYRGAPCATHNDHRHRFHGWHLSYAMNTSAIRQKLRSFSHAKDRFVRTTLQQNDSYFDTQAANCFDLFNRIGERGVCIDKYLPPRIGWPVHPLGARNCDKI